MRPQPHPTTPALCLGLLLGLLLAGAAGCRRDDPAPAVRPHRSAPVAPAIDPLPGTARMAGALAAIYADARREPFRYYHMNRAQADCLRVQLARTAGPEQHEVRYRLLTELLRGGEIDEALQVLDQIDAALGPEASVLSEKSKPLFELRAIAHMRRGEVQNCALNHSGAACILPFTPDAVHRQPEEARHAMALYGQILEAFPDDLASRWLLNVAAMAMGTYPRGVPARFRIDGLEAPRAPRIARFPNVAPALGVDASGLAGGVVLEDFNGDGFIDILTSAYGLNEPMRFFLADGRGGFIDHTGAAGLTGLVSGLNLSHADYDNDGDADVLVLRGAWLGESGTHPNSLLRNNGDGTFEDVAEAAGLRSHHPTQNGTWADFNNDGWIDLFIGNEAGAGRGGMGQAGVQGAPRAHPSELYMNNGDGTFTDVARRVGIDLNDFVKGSSWGDVDNDGLRDLYVSVIGGPKRLYVNRGGTAGADWRFEEAGAAVGVQGAPYTFSTFFFDYDNDGWDDLFVASFDPTVMGNAAAIIAAEYLGKPAPGNKNLLFHNNRDGTFTNVAAEMGVARCLWTMGMNFGDLNTDGFPDLYLGTGAPDLRSLMPNRAFLNDRGGGFLDVTFDAGLGHLQKGHAVAFADLDRDGDEDLYEVMGGAYEGDFAQNALYENPGAADHPAWVVLHLEGRTANRSAIGARIRVRVTNRDGTARLVFKTVNAGGSFGASSLQQEIGLGPAARIDEVRITWPNRAQTTETYADVAPNRYYRIVEGGGIAPLERPPVRLGGGSAQPLRR